MRANVMHDAALLKLAGRFAWLSIDSDREANAAFVEKFPIGGWPSFLVIDPATEKVVLHWYGTATAVQLAAMAEDGARWIAGGGRGVERTVARADALNSRKEYAAAAQTYGEALAAAPKNWSRRARVLESRIMALGFARDSAACLELAAREAPAMPRDRSFANVVFFGLECAAGKADKQAESLIPLAREAVKLEGIFSDDRSGLYSMLTAYFRARPDAAAEKEAAAEWWAMLAAEVEKEQTPEGRASCVANMSGPARILGVTERLVPYLQRWERDLPRDYNASQRLAGVLLGLKRYDEALAAAGRNLEKSYGAPKIGAYRIKASIEEAKGDAAAARKTLAAGQAYGETLPPRQAAAQLKLLRAALEKLGQKQ